MVIRPESRIAALEKRASTLEAAFEELSGELKTIRDDISRLFELTKTGFGESHGFQASVTTKEDLAGVETHITALENRIAQIEATMATKEDLAEIKSEMAAMEKRIYTTMDMQRESLFDGIRQLLQQKSGE